MLLSKLFGLLKTNNIRVLSCNNFDDFIVPVLHIAVRHILALIPYIPSHDGESFSNLRTILSFWTFDSKYIFNFKFVWFEFFILIQCFRFLKWGWFLFFWQFGDGFGLILFNRDLFGRVLILRRWVGVE